MKGLFAEWGGSVLVRRACKNMDLEEGDADDPAREDSGSTTSGQGRLAGFGSVSGCVWSKVCWHDRIAHGVTCGGCRERVRFQMRAAVTQMLLAEIVP